MEFAIPLAIATNDKMNRNIIGLAIGWSHRGLHRPTPHVIFVWSQLEFESSFCAVVIITVYHYESTFLDAMYEPFPLSFFCCCATLELEFGFIAPNQPNLVIFVFRYATFDKVGTVQENISLICHDQWLAISPSAIYKWEYIRAKIELSYHQTQMFVDNVQWLHPMCFSLIQLHCTNLIYWLL